MAWRTYRRNHDYSYHQYGYESIPESSTPVDPHLRYRATYAANRSGFEAGCRSCYGPFDEGSLQLCVKIQVTHYFYFNTKSVILIWNRA